MVRPRGLVAERHGRFLAEGLNRQEILQPQHRTEGHLEDVPWADALRGLGQALQTARNFRVVASANLSNEELYLAKRLFSVARRAEIVVPVLTGEPRRIKNGAGGWLDSQDAHPNAAGARRLGLRVVDQKALVRFLYGAADLTVILDAGAHPFLETEEVLQLLRVGQTVVFARLDNPVTRLATWLLPTPSQACNTGSFSGKPA